jgi:hypothetical protein
MLTACVGHLVFDCDSVDLVVGFAALIPMLFSHGGRTFMDIIVTLRLRSSALRWISDAILAFSFRPFESMALRMHTDSLPIMVLMDSF